MRSLSQVGALSALNQEYVRTIKAGTNPHHNAGASAADEHTFSHRFQTLHPVTNQLTYYEYQVQRHPHVTILDADALEGAAHQACTSSVHEDGNVTVHLRFTPDKLNQANLKAGSIVVATGGVCRMPDGSPANLRERVIREPRMRDLASGLKQVDLLVQAASLHECFNHSIVEFYQGPPQGFTAARERRMQSLSERGRGDVRHPFEATATVQADAIASGKALVKRARAVAAKQVAVVPKLAGVANRTVAKATDYCTTSEIQISDFGLWGTDPIGNDTPMPGPLSTSYPNRIKKVTSLSHSHRPSALKAANTARRAMTEGDLSEHEVSAATNGQLTSCRMVADKGLCHHPKAQSACTVACQSDALAATRQAVDRTVTAAAKHGHSPHLHQPVQQMCNGQDWSPTNIGDTGLECYQDFVDKYSNSEFDFKWVGTAPACNSDGDCGDGYHKLCISGSNGYRRGDFAHDCWSGNKKLCVRCQSEVKSPGEEGLFGVKILTPNGYALSELPSNSNEQAKGNGRYRLAWRYTGEATDNPIYVRLKVYEVDDVSDDACMFLNTEEYGAGGIPLGTNPGDVVRVTVTLQDIGNKGCSSELTLYAAGHLERERACCPVDLAR